MNALAATFMLFLLSCVGLPKYGFTQAQFYQGKTITVIVSSDAGGTSDMRVRSLVHYLQIAGGGGLPER